MVIFLRKCCSSLKNLTHFHIDFFFYLSHPGTSHWVGLFPVAPSLTPKSVMLEKSREKNNNKDF